MPGKSSFFLKALGLNSQPNQLDVSEGSLVEAINCIIRRDNVIEPRRGFRLYGTEFGTSSDTAKQIMEYRQRLIRHYDSTLQFDTLVENEDGESIFNTFAGSYSEVQEGVRIKSIESNNNLYFTTSDGIKKISAASADDLSTDSGFITNAGGIKALDAEARLSITYGSSTGFLPTDAAVAYRIVWGIKDANNNIILGTPSSRAIVYNPLLEMIIRDYMVALYALDQLNTTGSVYNDGNYVSSLGLEIGATASVLRDNLISLTEKLDAERGTLFSLADFNSGAIAGGVATIKVDNLEAGFGKIAAGDIVYLDGFVAGTSGTLDGPQTVTTVSTDGTDFIFTFNTTATGTVSGGTVTSGSFRGIEIPDEPSLPATHDELESLQIYLENIILELQSERNINLVANNDGTPAINPLEITTAAVTGTTTLTVNFDTSVTNTDAQNQFLVGDKVVLAGAWTAAGAEDISGVQTVATVTTGNITLTLGTAVTNGAVTLNTASEIDRIQRFTDALQVAYIDELTITTTANTFVTINIPPEATTSNFFQIYRSNIVEATGTDVLADLTPDDEMKLVYENFPTDAEISTGYLTVEDVVPDSFIQGATNLYTNQNSGEGILQSNDIPPLALDINIFKNYTWYANTKTRHRQEVFMLGVTGILQDYNDGFNPVIEIANENTHNTYRFVAGVQEVTQVTTLAGASLAASGPASYFLLNSANDATMYYVWYAIGTATDPALSGKTGIQVFALATDTNAQIASKTRDKLNTIIDDFEASSTTNVLTITNVDEGPATNASAGTSGFTVTVITPGVGENIAKEITNFNIIAGSLYVTAGTADYFTLNTAFDRQLYAFWFNVSGGTMTAPVLSGRTVVPIDILSGDTAPQVAAKVKAVLDLLGHWDTSLNSNVLTTTGVFYGPTVNATEVVVNAGFTVTITQNGALDVLLSNSPSPSIAVDATSRSLVKAINRNEHAEIISAFYLSGSADTPGDILFESQGLSNTPFYVVTNQDRTGASFNPNLSPSVIGITNTAANPTVVSATNHGMQDGDEVFIVGSNSFPTIDGVYTISNVVPNVSFTIPVNVITAGTTGSLIPVISAEISDNEVKPNRIYYSKLQQPEAVPILNYIDVGSVNKAILRIFPLRDSLFVFKEEGLYRISGETPPWNLALFDNNTKLIAGDSIGSSNNLLYCWAKAGIVTVSEAGVQLISRPIDTLILKISSSSQFTNFPTLTWGIGYDSDNAYYVYTVKETTDTVATICYRYSNLTNTWTVFDKTNTCGHIYSVDDKLYMGAGDVNFLEQERKDFERTDYADRQYPFDLFLGNYFTGGSSIKLENADVIEVGDVVVQDQTLTVYTYNQLLKKLDIDSQVDDDDYFETLEAAGGDNMRTKLEELAAKLDSDPGLSNIHTFLPGNVNTGTDTITITSHGYSAGDPVKFSTTGTLPGGLNNSDYFYIINTSTNTFQVSATEGGSAINLTTTGTGTHTIKHVLYEYGIVERTNFPIVSNSAANPTVVTSTNHGLQTSRLITISNVTGSNPTINGTNFVTRFSANTFSLAIDELSPGTGGTFTTNIQDFRDINSCFDIIVGYLNLDSGAAFSNYNPITGNTIQEAIVTNVNTLTGIITLTPKLEFVVGPLTVYKKIDSTFTYSPSTLGDPVGSKQLYESTVMFQNKTFTEATLSFSTDLFPEFLNIAFNGLGNGIFGHENFGENYFGGDSHQAPFRTYIPRQCQRCRFINIKFAHGIAREKYSIYGVSLTGRTGLSSRAYR